MIPFLIGTLAFVLILLSFIKKKSRIIPALLLLVGGLIVVGGTQSADMLNMEYRFNAGVFGELPAGFVLIYRTIKDLGFSFSGFKILYMLAVLIPIYKMYSKYTDHVAAAIVLFVLYPFPDFTGQIRNSLAATFAMVAMLWYICSDKRNSWIWYSVAIALCGMIHPSTLIYLVALAAKKNVKARSIVVVALIAAVAVFIAFASGLLYTFVSMFTDSDRIRQWFVLGESTGNNIKIYLVVTVGQFTGTMTLLYARNRISAQKYSPEVLADYRNTNTTQLTYNQVNSIARVNALLLLILPFYVMSPMYFRMYKYILILDYLVFCQASFSRKRKDQFLYLCVTLLVIFANLMSKRHASADIFGFGFLKSFSFGNISLFS